MKPLALFLASSTVVRAAEPPEPAACPVIKVATFDVAATTLMGSAATPGSQEVSRARADG